MQQIVINGKFLAAQPTGVHRVALEITRAAFDYVHANRDLMGGAEVDLWVPENAAERASRENLPYKVVSPFEGIPWEHVTLPWVARDRVILSLCNVGPVLSTNAITMMHDAQIYLTPASYSWPFRLWYRFNQPIAGRRHRKLLTVSEYSRNQLVRFGVAKREHIHVLYNGTDHVHGVTQEPSLMKSLGLDSQPYVVGLANTQHHKNLNILLRAFSDKRLSGLKLVLFGSATKNDFQAMGCDVPSNVIFTGRVSDGQLYSLYSRAICIAFPSRTEGFGLPPLEAMALGCPAIVAPCGALPEVCGDGAIYAEPDDPEKWVKNILKFFGEPAHRNEFAQKGREQASKFRWQDSGQELIDLVLGLKA